MTLRGGLLFQGRVTHNKRMAQLLIASTCCTPNTPRRHHQRERGCSVRRVARDAGQVCGPQVGVSCCLANGVPVLGTGALARPPCLQCWQRLMLASAQASIKRLKPKPAPPVAPLHLHSHALAAAAQAAGRFKDEIVPVQTVLKDPKTGAQNCEMSRGKSGIVPVLQTVLRDPKTGEDPL